MKRLFAYLLAVICMLTSLTACNLFGEEEKVTCEKYENCALFTFDYFEGSYTVQLDRKELGEGKIYYQANLKHGCLTVNYKDIGFDNEEKKLIELTADDEMPVNGSNGYITGDKIEISFRTLSPVDGEIIIAFTEDALKAVHGNLQLHEHTLIYTSDEYSHSFGYTCGCATPPNAAAHSDGDGDGKCDVCQYFMGIAEPVHALLHEREGWLLELEAENVAEIKTTFEYVGVAPGEFKEIKSTTDKAVIADVLENYAYTAMESIFREDTYIDGGSAFTIEFILTDGTVKELSFNNGNYIYRPDGNDTWALEYFRLDSIPTLQSEPYDNVSSYCSFITYIGIGEIYSNGGELLCEIPMDAFEFVRLEKDPGICPWEMYRVETEFGDLIFCTDTVFYIGLSDGDSSVQYQLVGKTIQELIAEYTAE